MATRVSVEKAPTPVATEARNTGRAAKATLSGAVRTDVAPQRRHAMSVANNEKATAAAVTT